VLMVFFIALITGIIYSPHLVLSDILTDLEFFPAYFLEILSFLSYALMLGIFVQRSGLTIILLLLSHMIEGILKLKIPDGAEAIKDFLPMQSITNLVALPFARYALQEIQDYVAIGSVLIALAWAFLFNYFAYLRLKKSDI
jgi:ABC-2 type transport system permease protein